RQAQHDDVPAAEVLQPGGQPAARIDPVGEEHAPSLAQAGTCPRHRSRPADAVPTGAAPRTRMAAPGGGEAGSGSMDLRSASALVPAHGRALPADHGPLIGRDDAVRGVVELLDLARLVTLT